MQTGDLKMISTNTTVTSGGNRNSSSPAITNNGRLIAFHSEAFNLVPSDPNGDVSDVFVYNSQSISMSLVSLDSAGADTNAASSFPDISDDGQYVVFESLATDLGSCTTGQGDIFVRDTVNDTNTCISIASGGGDANAASITPVISGDGSSVVFASSATNLLPPGTDTNGVDDIFIRDSAALNPTLRISLSETGSETSTGGNALPSVSANGRYVAFVSSATDLVANDTNGAEDVFVRDTQGGNSDIVRVSVDANGNQGVNNDASGLPSISDDGRYISFSSNDVLDAADTNGAGISDVYRGLNATFP
jgi:Tol biopolymer transport system component